MSRVRVDVASTDLRAQDIPLYTCSLPNPNHSKSNSLEHLNNPKTLSWSQRSPAGKLQTMTRKSWIKFTTHQPNAAFQAHPFAEVSSPRGREFEYILKPESIFLKIGGNWPRANLLALRPQQNQKLSFIECLGCHDFQSMELALRPVSESPKTSASQASLEPLVATEHDAQGFHSRLLTNHCPSLCRRA